MKRCVLHKYLKSMLIYKKKKRSSKIVKMQVDFWKMDLKIALKGSSKVLNQKMKKNWLYQKLNFVTMVIIRKIIKICDKIFWKTLCIIFNNNKIFQISINF